MVDTQNTNKIFTKQESRKMIRIIYVILKIVLPNFYYGREIHE